MKKSGESTDRYDDAIRCLFLDKILCKGNTSFTAQLLQLIQKADMFNRAHLKAGFPDEVKAWCDWYTSPDEVEFFKKHGFDRGGF